MTQKFILTVFLLSVSVNRKFFSVVEVHDYTIADYSRLQNGKNKLNFKTVQSSSVLSQMYKKNFTRLFLTTY